MLLQYRVLSMCRSARGEDDSILIAAIEAFGMSDLSTGGMGKIFMIAEGVSRKLRKSVE